MSGEGSRELGAERWNSPRNMRRAFLRAGIAGLASIPFVAGPDILLATCAWTLVPIALHEFWSAPRKEAHLRAVGFSLCSFGLAFGLLLAAHFQVVYAHEVLSTQSVTSGLSAVTHELSNWVHEKAFLKPTTNASVFVFLAAQSCAMGCATAPLLRVRTLGAAAVTLALALICAVPLVDWVAFAILHGEPISGVLPVVSAISSVMLGMGSLCATIGLLGIYVVADRFEQRLWPTTPAHPPTG